MLTYHAFKADSSLQDFQFLHFSRRKDQVSLSRASRSRRLKKTQMKLCHTNQMIIFSPPSPKLV